MFTEKPVLRLRRGFKAFVLARMAYLFDQGEFDEVLEKFAIGASLNFSFNVDLLDNDILVLRGIAGYKEDPKVTEKVRRSWLRHEKRGNA